VSLQPEEILRDPSEAFLHQPGFLEGAPAPIEQPVEQHPDFAKIAVGIAAALVILRLVMKHELGKTDAQTPEEIQAAAHRIYRRIFPAWLQASVPAITQAYRLGSTHSVSYAELEKMATDYATELGDFVNDSSILALTDAFNAQVNAGWSERLAWQRAREAYGLDSVQMRSYVKGLMAQDKEGYTTDPVPAAARSAVDRAFLIRADRIGTNEAFKASQVGRNMVWIMLASAGELPPGTMKKWVTAEDERVCGVCGPLDQVTIPLHQRFETLGGEKFYAPGVHPNCRCELEIVYPDLGNDVVKAMPGDPYNRNAEGEFASREERKGVARVKGVAREGVAREGVSREGVNREATGVVREAAGGNRSAGVNRSVAGVNRATDVAGVNRETWQQADALMAQQRELLAESEKKLASTRSRALSQRENATFTREFRPDDPQMHTTTAFMPADGFIKAMRLNRKAVLTRGTPITIGTQDEHGFHGVQAFHQSPDTEADLETSPAFASAFASYLDTLGSDIIERHKVSRESRPKGMSDYEKFGDNPSLAEFGNQRRMLANRSKRDLMVLVSNAKSTSEGREAIRNSQLEDYDWLFESEPNDLANEVMWALASERDLYDHEASQGRLRGTPWNDEVDRLGGEVNDDDVEFGMAGVEGARERFGVQPIFFAFPEWYGVREGEPDTDNPVWVEGDYQVMDVSPPQTIPDDLLDDMDAREIMNHAVIVTLGRVQPPRGE